MDIRQMLQKYKYDKKTRYSKSNMNMTSPSVMLVFGCYPHRENCDILSEHLVSHRLQSYLSIKQGGLFMYINNVKSRHVIRLPTTCGYHRVIYMYSKSYFSVPVNHNTLHHFFASTFYHFPCLHILKEAVISITNYNYGKYFSIAAWVIFGVSYDSKVK